MALYCLIYASMQFPQQWLKYLPFGKTPYASTHTWDLDALLRQENEIYTTQSFEQVLTSGDDLVSKANTLEKIYFAKMNILSNDDTLRTQYKSALDVLYSPYVVPDKITDASKLLKHCYDVLTTKVDDPVAYRLAQLQLLSVSLLVLSIVKDAPVEKLLEEKSVVDRLIYDRERSRFIERLQDKPLYWYESPGNLWMHWLEKESKRQIAYGLHGCSPKQLETLTAKGFAIAPHFLKKWA